MKILGRTLSAIVISSLILGCSKKEGNPAFPHTLDFIQGHWQIDIEREARVFERAGMDIGIEEKKKLKELWISFEGSSMTSRDTIGVELTSTLSSVREGKNYLHFQVFNENLQEFEEWKVIIIDEDAIRIGLKDQFEKAQQFLRFKDVNKARDQIAGTGGATD